MERGKYQHLLHNGYAISSLGPLELLVNAHFNFSSIAYCIDVCECVSVCVLRNCMCVRVYVCVPYLTSPKRLCSN